MRGEHVCTNADVIRNASFSWSPMSADEIAAKTGIEQRCYTSREPEQLALHAARAALAKSGRSPAEIGAILVSTCTSNRQIPSIACWLSGELGLQQTHASVDMVAACAGLPYGMSEAVRQLQEVRRPVLLVCVEKFSDKIGAVRTSRMIFGDGAAAMVIAPAADGPDRGRGGGADLRERAAQRGELDHLAELGVRRRHHRVRSGGEGAGPAVPGADARRARRGSRTRTTPGRTLLESIELIVPHQANKTMILNLAGKAGLSADQLYFNVERMGNVSAASIPIAVYDAVRDGVITGPVRVFAPGFGAGAVGGYAVMRIDPAIVADEVVLDVLQDTDRPRRRPRPGAPSTTSAPRSVSSAMSRPDFAFQRVAIVNRGEPAMRLINAVREWNAEGRPALRVIAVYTAADRHATFVREADEAVLIGPGPEPKRTPPSPGAPTWTTPSWSARCAPAGRTRFWPGWGFVSEKAEFAELCDRLGIIFIGPSAEVMRRLGDKIESKLLAEQAGCRSRRGAAAQCPTWPPPARRPNPSATR